MKTKLEDIEEKIKTYKQINYLVELYDREPDEWTIRLFHWHDCMLGNFSDYSSIDLVNDKVVLRIIKSLKKDLVKLKKELNL